MWTFPINPSTDEASPPPITIAKEVEPTACETECTDQQNALVACVDSIRAARLQQAVEQSDDGSPEDGDGDATTTSTDTPECLPMAVAAWTKCCEEANLRQKEDEEEKKSDG